MTQLRLTLGTPALSRAEIQFAEFHRTRLRVAVGSRVQATVLRDAYLAWAERTRCESISFKQLGRWMIGRGHRRIYSNGARYLDVELLTDAEALGLEAERHLVGRDRSSRMIERIDAIVMELSALRLAAAELAP